MWIRRARKLPDLIAACVANQGTREARPFRFPRGPFSALLTTGFAAIPEDVLRPEFQFARPPVEIP